MMRIAAKILQGALIALAFTVAGLAVAVVLAHAAPPENADLSLAPWFQSLRQPGTGMSCCGIADCRSTEYMTIPDGYQVLIDDRWPRYRDWAISRGESGASGHWAEVPEQFILQQIDNPTGRAVVCWTPDQGVMCFVRPSES